MPKIVSKKVRMASVRFQPERSFLFSWTMMEWTKAVPVSQGIKLAFSTGSTGWAVRGTTQETDTYLNRANGFAKRSTPS